MNHELTPPEIARSRAAPAKVAKVPTPSKMVLVFELPGCPAKVLTTAEGDITRRTPLLIDKS